MSHLHAVVGTLFMTTPRRISLCLSPLQSSWPLLHRAKCFYHRRRLFSRAQRRGRGEMDECSYEKAGRFDDTLNIAKFHSSYLFCFEKSKFPRFEKEKNVTIYRSCLFWWGDSKPQAASRPHTTSPRSRLFPSAAPMMMMIVYQSVPSFCLSSF